MKSDNKKHDCESFADFKRWVISLNREELLDAMAFTFQPDSNSPKSSSMMATIPIRGSLDSSPAAAAAARVNSHEYELLLSMVQLQPSPPTPVHPRATGYKSRSQKGARLDYYFKEEEHLRWTKPRLFQWAEQQEERQHSSRFYGSRSRNRNNRNRTNTTNHNPGGGASSSTASSKRRFHVIARQKVAPWGDVYSLGSTQSQCDADCTLIQGTRLGRHRRDGRYHATACFVGGSKPSHEPLGCGGSKSKWTAAFILDMLRIASRGQLFLQHSMSLDSNPPTADVSYCAPWLQPTERWFSLGMYLASRFQMALWDSYLKDPSNKRQQQQQQQQQYTVHPGRIIRQGGNWYGYNESIIQDSLIRAIQLGLREILEEEQTSSRLNYLRDGTLWSILEGTQKGYHLLPQIASRSLLIPSVNENPKSYWKSIARTWTQTKLVEMHIPFNRRFKSLVNEKLEEELVVRMEKAMFEEDELERQKGCNSNGVAAAGNKNKRRKKKRKKSKNLNDSTSDKNGSQTSNVTPTNLITLAETNEECDPVSIPSDSSSVQGANAPTCVPSTKFEFPKNSVTARERNRNIIFVLGMLEDITEEVFSKVGLMATPKFDDPVQVTTTISVSETNSNSKRDSSLPNLSHEEDIISNKNDGGVKASIEVSSSNNSSKSYTSGVIHTSRSLDQESTNHNDDTAFTLYRGKNESSQSNIYNPFAVGSDFELNNLDDIGGYVDNWRFANSYESRERSILANFFESQNGNMDNGEDDDDEERLMAASTAASIASSSYKDTTYVAETEEHTVPANVVTERPPECAEMSAIRETDDVCSKSSNETGKNDQIVETIGNAGETSSVNSSLDFDLDGRPASFDEDEGRREVVAASSDLENGLNDIALNCDSPALQAPITPPPTLSPIVMSLADLKGVKQIPSLNFDKVTSPSGPGSLPPNSPGPKNGMRSSWSREDLRIESFRDDHHIQNRQRDRIKSRRSLEVPTYKSIAVKTLAKPIVSSREDTGSLDHEMQYMESPRRKQHQNKESCAQSETALDPDHREHQDWYREEVENHSLTKDETTTIISGISHRVESEELAVVQEERNNFRDMCLTLGAEVAKLKVILATQQAAAAAPVDFQDSSFGYSKMYGHGSFDPHGTQPFFNGMQNGLRRGPMSDAGFHRSGDHESIFSEDEVYDPISKAREARLDSVQRIASSQTVAESDASMDFNSIKASLPGAQLPGTISAYDSFHFNGLQSRLTKDILQFLDATNIKMKKLDGRRKLAVERFSRLVKTVWPRAQVKLYGSYISGLCLPSSDLDFVVCLPAVHKKDLALAPGVLEGRNAINETSQKLLARELKGESWIDPRSIKVIERTAVPVIKVSTKDTRARMIQLDISFDGPEHHGQDANRMVAQTLEELPLIRPLMLVLKQFLLHRGLLTAYTGGLSSYGLFLMLARYLQEQPASSGDCGSLLMGFLDFYGNFFDPRAIGISVGGRRYFARANSNTAAAGYEPTGQPNWNRYLPPHPQHQKRVVINNLPPNASSSSSIVFRRRNSFSDTGSVDGSRHRPRFFAKPATTTNAAVPSGPNHRFVPLNKKSPSTRPQETNFRSRSGNNNIINNNFSGYDRPSTFDPLFVEDPLSATNNVGRNAFRFNQVQRAFSDAHRALVASLDWDIQSAEVTGKYPLLKCLLGNQREDVLYGI